MPFQHLPLAAGLGRNGPEIFFYGIGIALLVAVAFLAPHRGAKCLLPIERLLARLARRRALAVLTVAFVAGVLAAGIAAVVGIPMPKVDDEFSYLLAADTFVHGRLANPAHSMWEHFETFHVLNQPTYASKYPPAQGLFLALGQIVFHPILGVWLGTALACAAVTWMLMAWLPARWALLGGLLAAVHPEVIVWSQRYWGGCLAMAGGAVAIGGFRRILNAPRIADAFLMAVGIAMLLFTRPYEGFVTTMLLGSVLLFAFFRSRIPLRIVTLRVVLPAAAALTVAMTGLGFYNSRVTGNPLQMPYSLHVSQYMAAPIFIGQKPPPLPAYRHADIRDFHTGWEYSGYEKQRTPAGLAIGFLERTWRLVRGDMRIWFLSISFVALPWSLRSDRWMRLALLLTLAFFSALLLVNWTFFHYAAPAFGLFFFSAIQCMRHLRLWRWREKPVGLFLARTSVVLCAVSVLQTASAIAKQSPDGWWDRRREILDQLKHERGTHLIVIRYAPGIVNTSKTGYRDWTRNGADIDSAEVVWAREMDADHNRRLLDYFKERRAWLLDVDTAGAKLLPYPH